VHLGEKSHLICKVVSCCFPFDLLDFFNYYFFNHY